LKKKQHGTSRKIPGSGKISMLTKYTSLKLTNNSKVRFRGEHHNTFSLRPGLTKHGGSCPGATEGKGGCVDVCYDCNLRGLYKNYARAEDANFELLKDRSCDEMTLILQNTINKWLLTTGLDDPYFRIHTGGDFFNIDYAKAWRHVIDNTPEVSFWTYTRSLFAVPILVGAKNLTLMLSTDPVNKDRVLEVYAQHKEHENLAIAWMGDELFEGFPQDRKLLVCPAVTKKLKNTEKQGACSRCRACIDRPLRTGQIRHVQFPIHR
jgi:hypothetical protein